LPPATDDDGAPELTEEASKAIESGLKHLLKTQGKDGSWSSGKFQMASTSLALMAFMVKGEFPGYGPNAEALDKAKNWLLKQAKSVADGYLGKSMYEHGLATLALSELWGMTAGEKDDEDLQKALEAAVNVILRSQNVGGGWRYQPSPDAGQDTSVTVMVFIGLASARQAGIMVPDEAIKRLVSYLEGAQDQGSGGFSYAPTGKGVSIACSGGGTYAAQLCGERDSQMVKAAINYVSNLPDGTFANTGHYFYTHYYAIQAMVQAGDEYYAEWYPKIRDALVEKQKQDGSWGQLYQTSMAILILGTPHRFIPIYQR
jgi:squalene cyclase